MRLTGEGENLYTMGGLVGYMEEQIIRIPIHNQGEASWSDLFEVYMLYIAYNGEWFNFTSGYKAGIDTGSSITVLPAEVMQRFWRVVKPNPSFPNLSEGETMPAIPYLIQQ